MPNRWVLAAVFGCLLSAGTHADPMRVDLETATLLAEASSFELSKLMYGVKGEQRRYRLQQRDSLPQVSFHYADSKAVQYYAPDSRNISLSAAVQQPLFRGGRTRISREIQRSGILLQQQGVESSRQSLHDECFTQFYSYLIGEKKIALLDEARRLGDAQLTIAQVELQIGVSREVDYLETQLQLKELEQRILSARADLEQTDYGLKLLLGLEPDQSIELVGGIDQDYGGLVLRGSPQTYTSIATENNLGVAQARFQVAQNRARVLLSRTTWIPDIWVEASASISGNDYPLQEPGYSLNLIVEFPYEWLPLKASVGLSNTTSRQYGQSETGSVPLVRELGFLVDRDLAKLELQAALDARAKFLRDLEFNVKRTLKAHERERANLRLLRETIALRERQLRILQAEVEVGESKRIDFVEAQNELLDRRLELLEAVLNLILIERSFERLLGLDLGGLAELEASRGTS
jgi:outer membrane protein TolC